MSLAREGGEPVVAVRDDGRGLPAGFRLEDGDRLDFRIANTLAAQLGGRFTLERAEPGAVAWLVAPS